MIDYKDELEKLASDIQWRPAYMKERYVDWVRNLRWDWCISRQRFFGVPFPLWYCASCGAVKLADESSLPVDPLSSSPPTPCSCGSMEFRPESDVMDTWATSSVSPQINARWGEAADLMERIFPFSMRPQAHDIIRTWAFYTIVKSYFHHGCAPWKEIMISGHSRDPAGNKLSKSKGNAGETPSDLVAKYGADPVRYWAASAKLGTDSVFSEKVVADGRRLVLKLWNAAQLAGPFVERLARTQDTENMHDSQNRPIEEWIRASYRQTVRVATEALDEREYDGALSAVESFFRRDFCDDYLELCKPLAGDDNVETLVAARTIQELLYGILRLFAPFLPHIAEELYQRLLRDREGHPSIHVAPWPSREAIEGAERAIATGRGITSLIDDIRRAKTEAKRSLAAPIARLHYSIDEERLPPGFAIALEIALPRISSMLRIDACSRRPFDPGRPTSVGSPIAIHVEWA